MVLLSRKNKLHERLIYESHRIVFDVFKNPSGATAIEYALIAGGIALAIIATVFAIGEPTDGLLGSANDAFDSM